MSANYKLVRNPDPTRSGKTQPYHVRFVPNGTVSTDLLIKSILPRSSFSSADYKGMLQLIQDAIVENLLFGYNVKLEGIGTFTISLKCPPLMDKKKVRSEAVSFRDVKFRSSLKLRQRLTGMRVYRAREVARKIFSLEECENRLMDYFENNFYITGRIYMTLNHCCKTKAAAHLKQFRQEGKIVRQGYGPTTFYTKAMSEE